MPRAASHFVQDVRYGEASQEIGQWLHADWRGLTGGLGRYPTFLAWVWSYGRLPGGLTTDNLRRNHPSIRRNELIADVFYRRGYIEKWGRGTQRIIELSKVAGASEPEFLEQAGKVGVRFWPAFQLPIAQARQPLTARQEKLLAALRTGRTLLSELVAAVGAA